MILKYIYVIYCGKLIPAFIDMILIQIELTSFDTKISGSNESFSCGVPSREL